MKNRVTEKKIILVLVFLLMGVISYCVLSNKIPETEFVEDTLYSLEESKLTVIEFTGATLATSLAISALPDDFASPIANNLAGMDKYFILILMVLFVEKLIVLYGTKLAFMIVFPLACLFAGIYVITKARPLQTWAVKFAILGMSLFLVVPISTHLVDYFGAEYLEYVDDTIENTQSGADKINDIMSDTDGDDTIFEKLSGAFKVAIQGISDLLSYFNDVVKKCVNSIAILIVSNCITPLMVLFAFRWIWNQLFDVKLFKEGSWRSSSAKIAVKEE